jgi:hypothetical protein
MCLDHVGPVFNLYSWDVHALAAQLGKARR